MGLLTPSRSWSVGHWIAYGLLVALMLLALVNQAVGARGPWFGVLALAVYVPMYTTGVLQLHRTARWPRMSPTPAAALFAIYFAALILLTVGSLTAIPLQWCTVIAATTSAAFTLLIYARRDTTAGRPRHAAGPS